MNTDAQPPTSPAAPRKMDGTGAAIRLLWVAADATFPAAIQRLLSDAGADYDFLHASTYDMALSRLNSEWCDIGLVAGILGAKTGADVIRDATSTGPRPPMIVLADHEDPVLEAAAMASGASDFLVGDELSGSAMDRAVRFAIHRADADSIRARQLNEAERKTLHLISVLGRLRAGAIVTGEGGVIEFMSDSARRLLGLEGANIALGFWHAVLPVDENARLLLMEMAERPALQRSRVTANADGTHWVDIEIHDDPSDSVRRIFFLHDATEVYNVRHRANDRGRFHELVGSSRAIREVYQRIREVAKIPMGVLIQGETGTGKELVARAIHYSGNRKATPFIAVNCAGLPESLLSSQLFGHKRGAFTGAIEDHKGVFESAHGGTLLLDEIGEIPKTVQVTLLRVLQEQEVTRLGESMPRKINTRVICATNRDLWQEVQEGRFRADLFYRVRVARIDLPLLRERTGDIPVLAVHFLEMARIATGKNVAEISAGAMRLLEQHDWPGNVRELKNAVEFALVRCAGQIVHADDLPPEIRLVARASAPLGQSPETSRILKALDDAQGNRSRAARLLGVSRATFYRRLAELHPGIERKRA